MSVSYKDLCENCRMAEKVWRHSKRVLNDSLKRNKASDVGCQTRVMAVLYCTVAESYFAKILNTPDSLLEDEIQVVKDTAKNAGISNGWKKCLEIALKKCEASPNGSHIPNVKQKVCKLIDTYILEPSTMRNKFAHGQWENALNREQTEVNAKITDKIKNLDVAEIEKFKYALTQLSQIMTDILASPNKAHIRDFWTLTCNLEEELDRRRNWNESSKQRRLKRKRSLKVAP